MTTEEEKEENVRTTQSEMEFEYLIQKRIEEDDRLYMQDILDFEMYEAMSNMEILRLEGILK